MTPVHAIMVLIIRLWAAGFIITAVLNIGLLPYDLFGRSGGIQPYQIQNHVFSGGWFLIGVWGWVFARMLAQRLFPQNQDESIAVSIDSDTLVMIGSFLIGGFYLVQYVPEMITQLGMLFIDMVKREPDVVGQLGTIRVNLFNVERFFTNAMVVVAASWMTFKPAHLAKLFSKLRTLGQYALDSKQPLGDKRRQDHSED